MVLSPKDSSDYDRLSAPSFEDMLFIRDLTTEVSGSLDLNFILERGLTRLMALCRAEAGEILLQDEESKALRQVLYRGENAESLFWNIRFHHGEELITMIAEKGALIMKKGGNNGPDYLRLALRKTDFHFWMTIPLTAKRKVYGMFNLVGQDMSFPNSREIELSLTLSSCVSLAIENARLHHQLSRQALVDERERIGMDLHDGVIQSIYAAGLTLDNVRLSLREGLDCGLILEKVEQAIAMLDKTIGDIRTYILNLQPPKVNDRENLLYGLQRLVDEFQVNSNIPVRLTLPESEPDGILNEEIPVLYYICHESLANIVKHAQATLVKVHLWSTKDRVLLEITDDGVGFEADKTSTSSGRGLMNMQRRAQKAGGDVEIISMPGKGVTILAWVPRHKLPLD